MEGGGFILAWGVEECIEYLSRRRRRRERRWRGCDEGGGRNRISGWFNLDALFLFGEFWSHGGREDCENLLRSRRKDFTLKKCVNTIVRSPPKNNYVLFERVI